jgi:hypothetical protein
MRFLKQSIILLWLAALLALIWWLCALDLWAVLQLETVCLVCREAVPIRCASTVAEESASISAAKRRAEAAACKAVVAMDLMERWMEP